MDPDNKASRQRFKQIRRLSNLKESGNAAFQQGRTEEAVSLFTEALSVDPQHNQFNAQLHANR